MKDFMDPIIAEKKYDIKGQINAAGNKSVTSSPQMWYEKLDETLTSTEKAGQCWASAMLLHLQDEFDELTKCS